ncbi:MAG: phosphoribosylpyrophosphate synthetase [Sphingobacteriaceae bacterium]|nr:phosphoribosylpyrophosphate synthetase [Cytophagaceae bacterium]
MGLPDTLSQVISQLSDQGYTTDLNRREGNSLWLDPSAFQIDKVYRFEGATNPDDESILYALSSEHYRVRGVLVNGYGLSADPITASIEQRLQRWGQLVPQMGFSHSH